MNNKGFTLIELLVVISIMALLATVSFAKYASLREDQYLKNAANELQSLVRVAQTNAGSGVLCGSVPGATWLVEFIDSKTIDLKCYISDPAAISQKTLLLTNNIEVSGISGTGNCDVPVRVNFAPLYGTVTFTSKNLPYGSCFQSSNELTVTLRKIDGTGVTKVITFNKGGSVEIK